MRPEWQNSSASGQVNYSTELIREVAGKIIARVGETLPAHQSTWNTIQAYLEGDVGLPLSDGSVLTLDGPLPDVYACVRKVLEPHEQRLRASFDWQLQLAEALFDLADQVEQAEHQLQEGFREPEMPAVPHRGNNAW